MDTLHVRISEESSQLLKPKGLLVQNHMRVTQLAVHSWRCPKLCFSNDGDTTNINQYQKRLLNTPAHPTIWTIINRVHLRSYHVGIGWYRQVMIAVTCCDMQWPLVQHRQRLEKRNELRLLQTQVVVLIKDPWRRRRGHIATWQWHAALGHLPGPAMTCHLHIHLPPRQSRLLPVPWGAPTKGPPMRQQLDSTGQLLSQQLESTAAESTTRVSQPKRKGTFRLRSDYSK